MVITLEATSRPRSAYCRLFILKTHPIHVSGAVDKNGLYIRALRHVDGVTPYSQAT